MRILADLDQDARFFKARAVVDQMAAAECETRRFRSR
jgi:hypothetical protein